jgi:hypothetical protein
LEEDTTLPLTLAELIGTTKELTLPIGDSGIRFRYRPYAFTPAIEDELEQLGRAIAKAEKAEEEAAPESQLGIRKIFCVVIEKWDLVAKKGGPAIPIEVEALRQIPTKILNLILEMAIEDQQPPKPEPTVPGSFT